MDIYRLIIYGISKIFMVVCVGLFIRSRYSRKWTAVCLSATGAVLLGSEYLRFYLSQIGIEQRITNLLEFAAVLVVFYLSEERDSRAFFTGVMVCVYGSLLNIVGKLFYSGGVSLPVGIVGMLLISGVVLFLMVRYMRPAYRRMQEVYSREWRLFSLVLSLFMLALYLIYGAFKGMEVSFFHNVAILFYLIVICVLLSMAFRMLDQRWAEEMQERAQEILQVYEVALRQEMDEIRQIERRVAEYNHDTRHFVRMLGGMLAEEKYEGIRLLLDELQQSKPEEKNKSVFGNPVISGILDYYRKRISQAEIRMTAEVDVTNSLGEHEWELAAILGNLLENAMQACLRMKEPDRRKIRVNIHPAGEQTIFELRHSVDGPVRFDPVTGYPVMEWSRGMKMRSIAAEVEQWGGQMDCGQEQDGFFVRILV